MRYESGWVVALRGPQALDRHWRQPAAPLTLPLLVLPRAAEVLTQLEGFRRGLHGLLIFVALASFPKSCHRARISAEPPNGGAGQAFLAQTHHPDRRA